MSDYNQFGDSFRWAIANGSLYRRDGDSLHKMTDEEIAQLPADPEPDSEGGETD